jgi:hypothetical protein
VRRRGSKARARLRALCAAVLALGALAWAGSALAEARDRAVGAWIHGIESSLHAVRAAIPPPRASTTPVVRAPEPSAAAVSRPVRGRRSPPPPLAADERLDDVRARFCPEAARRLCRARQRCGCVVAEPDCELRVETRCTERLFSYFENGAESYELDPEALDRCLDGFAAVPSHCQLGPAVVHGCAWPIRDVAEQDHECGQATGRCRAGVCEGDLVCRAAPGVGDVSYAQTCAPDLVALDGTCVIASELGGACTDYRQCGDGLYDCTDERCVPRPRAGASCSSSADCDAGLACADGLCARAPIWCASVTDCGSEQECERPPMRCVPCEGAMDCRGPVRCTDGHRCGSGTTCDDGGETGRCGPILCRMTELEALFDRLN